MSESISADPGFCTVTSWIQLGYGLWVSLTMVGIGLAFGFPAVTIPQLNEANSTITISTSDESWIASVLTLAAPAGCLVCGYMMDTLGRKLILIICQLPLCVGWLLTGFAADAKQIIIGRIITGLGIGMSMGAPRIYVTEISLPNMRGTVGALPNLAMSMGLTILAAFGAFLKWTTICYVCGAYSLFLFLFNMLLPETPYFVLLKGTEENARKTLKWFRSKKYKVDREINDLMEYKTVNNIRRLQFKEELCLLFTKGVCRPFWIVFVYILLSQISGVTIIFMWTIELIEGSNSSVDANLGNFAMGMTRFITGIFSSLMLYRIGRKPQALISSVGVGLSFIALGSYIHSKSPPSVIPVVCYVSAVMFATLGYYTIPLLIMYELYPLQVRGLLGGITVSLLNFMIFGVNKLYPYLRNLIGIANITLCFGTSSLLGSIYLYFYLPETKGLTLQEIEEYFNDRRATLVSQRHVIAAQLSQGSSSKNVDRSATKSQDMKKNKSENKSENKSDQDKSDVLQLRKKKKDRQSEGSTSASKDERE